jgi:hypothetical protein
VKDCSHGRVSACAFGFDQDGGCVEGDFLANLFGQPMCPVVFVVFETAILLVEAEKILEGARDVVVVCFRA